MASENHFPFKLYLIILMAYLIFVQAIKNFLHEIGPLHFTHPFL